MSGWHIRDKSKVTIGAWLHKRTESCVMTTAHGHARSTEPYSLLLTAKGMYIPLPPPPPPPVTLSEFILNIVIYIFFSFFFFSPLFVCCCCWFCFFVCLFVCYQNSPFFPLSFLLLMWNFAGVGSQNVGSWPISDSQRLGELGLVHNELRSSLSHACWWMNVIWPTSGLNAKAYA